MQALDQHHGCPVLRAGGVRGTKVGGARGTKAGGDLGECFGQAGDVEVLEDGDAVEEGEMCVGIVLRVCRGREEEGVDKGGKGWGFGWGGDDADEGGLVVVVAVVVVDGGGEGGEVRGDEVGGES